MRRTYVDPYWYEHTYLKSPHWEQFKKKYYRRHAKRCAACRSTYRIHLHHKTYDHLWHESYKDVVPLCGLHHKLAHAYDKTRRYGSLAIATEAAISSVKWNRRWRRLGRWTWKQAKRVFIASSAQRGTK